MQKKSNIYLIFLILNIYKQVSDITDTSSIIKRSVDIMWIKIYIFAFSCVLMQNNVTVAKRILVIAGFPSFSHQIIYRGLCLELNRRGHEIVIATTHPINNSTATNYTEIKLQKFYQNIDEYNELIKCKTLTEMGMKLSILQTEKVWWMIHHVTNENVFKNPEMQKLYATDSNEHFDAVIVAQGPNPSLNAFAYRFNAPLIGKIKTHN